MRKSQSRFAAFAGISLLAATMVITPQSSLQANDGRWKVQDEGCVFDPNDSGPDQCDPTPGRNKLADDGSCYFDAEDTGPDQCSL